MDTTFVDQQTVVVADWLNDINNLRYGAGNSARGAALLQYMQAGTGAATRTAQDRLREVVSVKDFGAALDGVTNDNAAWAAAVTYVASKPFGGTITVPPGSASLITAAISVTSSNIQFDLPNFTFVLSGSASFAAIDFAGTGSTGGYTLASNAGFQATSISLTTSPTANDWIMLRKDAPNNGGAADYYFFITKVRSVSGAGPYTVVLESALPTDFNTTDTGLQITTMSFLENVGVTGPVTFDGTAATGTTVHGIEMINCVDSFVGNVHGVGLDAGAAVYAYYGHGNKFFNCSAEGCGNSNYNALMYIAQTAAYYGRQQTFKATGFGIGLHSNIYSSGHDFVSEGCAAGRGIKFQSQLYCTFTNIIANWSTGANGVAIAIGSSHNVFSNIVANGNPTNEGLWLSDQYNLDNQFFGVQAAGNNTRDVFVGATDTGNVFFGVWTTIAPYIGGSNATTLWFGLNGAFMSAGNSGNNPLLFISYLSAGVGAAPWIGLSASDLWINNKTGQNITFGINNVAVGYATVNGLQSVGGLRQSEAAALVRALVSLNNGAAGAVGTLNNAPTAGDPTKWIPIVDNGVTRYIPAW